METSIEKWIGECIKNGIFANRDEAIEFMVTFFKGLIDRFEVTKESLQKRYPDMSLPLSPTILGVIFQDIDEALAFWKGFENMKEMIP